MRSRTYLPITLIISAAASTSSAQQPPNYVDFIPKVERLAIASNSVGSCKRLGYTVDEKALEAFAYEFVDRAVRDGIPEGSANIIINGEVAAETERQEARVERAKANADDPEEVEAFMQYWRDRCQNLAADPVYGAFFRKG